MIHYDADENIHCLLAGRKDFMAVEKKYERSLYFLDIVSIAHYYNLIEESSGKFNLADGENLIFSGNINWRIGFLYCFK